MPHSLIDIIAAAWILLSLPCAVGIAIDVARRPQKMAVMNLVWPITALYAGPLAVAVYLWLGRPAPPDKPPLWRSALLGATHCGAGCAIGDFIADWTVFLLALQLFGSEALARFGGAFLMAYLFGLAFQFFAIAPMRGLGVKDGLVAAAKADTLSLLAYEIGMFAVMALSLKLAPELKPVRWSYWLMMDAAMLVGLATTYPVNAWLIRKGLKEAM